MLVGKRGRQREKRRPSDMRSMKERKKEKRQKVLFWLICVSERGTKREQNRTRKGETEKLAMAAWHRQKDRNICWCMALREQSPKSQIKCIYLSSNPSE